MSDDKAEALARAEKLLQRGDQEGALRAYEAARAADPGDQRLALKIGDLHVQRGDTSAAIAAYTAVADAYDAQGFALKALVLRKQVVTLDPERVASRLAVVRTCAKLKLTVDADSEVEAILAYVKKRFGAAHASGYRDAAPVDAAILAIAQLRAALDRGELPDEQCANVARLVAALG